MTVFGCSEAKKIYSFRKKLSQYQILGSLRKNLAGQIFDFFLNLGHRWKFFVAYKPISSSCQISTDAESAQVIFYYI